MDPEAWARAAHEDRSLSTRVGELHADLASWWRGSRDDRGFLLVVIQAITCVVFTVGGPLPG